MDQPLSVSHSDPGHPPADSTRKRRHLWIWVIILLLFALLFVWVWKQHSASTTPTGGGRGGAGGGAVAITTATAKKGSIDIYLNAIGTVTPTYTDSITSQVTGVITAVHYREGQDVRKGDPLIDIDSRPYEAQLAQAKGILVRDQNLLAEAQMDLTRYQDAWAKNAIQRQTLEDQEKIVLQDQGTVQNDQGTVQYDQVQVDFCQIKSPIDGRLGLRLVDPGNLVTANSANPLVVVAQIHPITVIFTLAEDSLPQVQQQTRGGKTLVVQAYDRTQQTMLEQGKLITIDNQIDTVTGTVKLRAQFANTKNMLFPNEFVNTRLLVKTLDNQTLIPSSAIQHNGSADFVYLIKNNKAIMRNVKSGISEGGNTAVTGINPGDVVANSSFQKLTNGSAITISKITIPAAASDTTEGAP